MDHNGWPIQGKDHNYSLQGAWEGQQVTDWTQFKGMNQQGVWEAWSFYCLLYAILEFHNSVAMKIRMSLSLACSNCL